MFFWPVYLNNPQYRTYEPNPLLFPWKLHHLNPSILRHWVWLEPKPSLERKMIFQTEDTFPNPHFLGESIHEFFRAKWSQCIDPPTLNWSSLLAKFLFKNLVSVGCLEGPSHLSNKYSSHLQFKAWMANLEGVPQPDFLGDLLRIPY